MVCPFCFVTSYNFKVCFLGYTKPHFTLQSGYASDDRISFQFLEFSVKFLNTNGFSEKLANNLALSCILSSPKVGNELSSDLLHDVWYSWKVSFHMPANERNATKQIHSSLLRYLISQVYPKYLWVRVAILHSQKRGNEHSIENLKLAHNQKSRCQEKLFIL